MILEIQKASEFLTNLVRVHCGKSINLENFCEILNCLLREHYQQHWFPESPNKGSGYRCIRINHKMDPILSRAGSESGFNEESLRDLFPRELTMWIDPWEVSYRIGENGSICVLYDGSTDRKKSSLQNSWSTPKRTVTIAIQSKNLNSSNSSEDDNETDDSCSPMSMSPPSPKFNRPPTCKESMRESGFIMDPRNFSYELPQYVSS